MERFVITYSLKIQMFKQSYFSPPANKNMFKALTKETRTVSVNVIRVSFDEFIKYLWRRLFLMKLQAFNITGSGGVFFTFSLTLRHVSFSKH